MEDFKLQLETIGEAIRAEFKGPAAVHRLAQVETSLATAITFLECLYDEAERMEGYR